MTNQIYSEEVSAPQWHNDWLGSISAIAAVISILPVFAHDHFTGSPRAWI